MERICTQLIPMTNSVLRENARHEAECFNIYTTLLYESMFWGEVIIHQPVVKNWVILVSVDIKLYGSSAQLFESCKHRLLDLSEKPTYKTMQMSSVSWPFKRQHLIEPVNLPHQRFHEKLEATASLTLVILDNTSSNSV